MEQFPIEILDSACFKDGNVPMFHSILDDRPSWRDI